MILMDQVATPASSWYNTGRYLRRRITMAAQPKNKITRAERGKRRRGNTPKITKDSKHALVPRHKQSLVDTVLKVVGLK